MILYMYIAPGQGQITSDDKISTSYRAFVTLIIFVMFHHDTPTSEGTRGQIPFFSGAGTDNSNGANFEHHRKLLSL